MAGLAALADRLPKTDLHVHFEGLVARSQYEAARSGRPSEFPPAGHIYKATFDGTSDLIDAIRRSNAILRSGDACTKTLRSYLLQSASQGVSHVELAVEPTFHLDRGLALEELFEGILAAVAEAEGESGLTTFLVLSIPRDRPVAEAFAMLDRTQEINAPIRAVGIAGYDHAQPLATFSNFMREAAARGHAIVAHAGEGTNASEIWEAINEFPVHRIDHGIAALGDPKLVRHLREQEIPLATAPISNHRTGASRDGAAIADLLRQGVKVSVSTDDPGTLQSTLVANYAMLIERQNLNAAELATLAANGFESSLLAPQRIAQHVAEIRAIIQGTAAG